MSFPSDKTRAAIMAAFDHLPADVRRAVAQADIAYDPDVLAARLKREKNRRKLVAEIRDRTARRMARSNAYEVMV